MDLARTADDRRRRAAHSRSLRAGPEDGRRFQGPFASAAAPALAVGRGDRRRACGRDDCVRLRASIGPPQEVSYVFGAKVCGVGAPSVRCMPTTAVIVCGATFGWPSSVSDKPDGLDAKRHLDRPWLDVALRGPRLPCGVPDRQIDAIPHVCRCFTGARNRECTARDPRVGPMNGCVCVSWWKTICHVNAVAGRTPSSASVAVPEYVITARRSRASLATAP